MIIVQNMESYKLHHWKCVSRAFGGTREGASAGATQMSLRLLFSAVKALLCNALQGVSPAALRRQSRRNLGAFGGAVHVPWRHDASATASAPFQRLQAPLRRGSGSAIAGATSGAFQARLQARFRHAFRRVSGMPSGAFQARHSSGFMRTSSISANVNNIPVLNDTNFNKWKEHVIIVLGCMDLDFALREDRLSDLTSASTAEQRSTMEKWERSNPMSLMVMKHSIPEAIRGAIPEETQAKAFLDQIAN
ncbi:hypothetical protein CK203_020958 [Vitis vinifera]|uniref:Uncharacterized protein n=1 Tax=Vitis vinifera TaxID=29760 RepID=A0A438JX54_VITVI|nr:hypothetical protein CK203_020958 [Vitis vinifera]